MKSTIQKIIIGLSVMGISLWVSALERADLLPPAAQLYVRVSNISDFGSQLKKSSLGKLWQDKQFQDFMGNPEPEIWMEMLSGDGTAAENKMVLEQFKMLKGEFVLGGDFEQEAPFIIAAMSEEDFKRSLVLDEKLKDSEANGFEIMKSSFQGIEIFQHIEEGGTPEENSSWQAFVKGTFLLGDSREWVEKSIVRLKKESIEEPKGNPTLTFNLPLESVLQQVLEEFDEEESASDEDKRLMQALGLMELKNFFFKLELKEDEMVVDSTVKILDLTKGIFTLFDVQPSQFPRISFVPSNIFALEIGRMDLLGIWQEVPRVIEVAYPTAKAQYDMILNMLQQQVGINFEQDLLVNLGTQYLSFAELGNEKGTSVIAVELKNPQAFKKALETMLSAPAIQPQLAAVLKLEEFLDHTLYTVKNSTSETEVAFGLVDNYFVYGTPTDLRSAIRRASNSQTTDSYEQSSLVKELRAQVSSRAFAYGAIDWEKYMIIVLKEFSKPQYIRPIQQKWVQSGSPLPPPDFKKLPSADHIASFFNRLYQYTEATDDGLHQRIILKY